MLIIEYDRKILTFAVAFKAVISDLNSANIQIER